MSQHCSGLCFCLDLVCFTRGMKRYRGSVRCSFYCGDESAKVGCRVSAAIIGIIGHKLESSLCTRTGTALLSPSLTRSRDCNRKTFRNGAQRLPISLELACKDSPEPGGKVSDDWFVRGARNSKKGIDDHYLIAEIISKEDMCIR